MKLLQNISRNYITEKWNEFSSNRFDQLVSGIDISYKYVLEPAIKGEIINIDIKRLLDVGCGSGILTKHYAEIANEVIAIDPSSENIEIAKKYCNEKQNIFFKISYAEDFIAENKFDCVMSNMVLMDVLDISGAIKSISDNLDNNGIFIFTITHPCFFPIYYNYSTADWFNYNDELIIENDFTITNEKSNCQTVHIHRPLHLYINLLSNNNLQILNIKELFGNNFSFPRFLLFNCKKLL